ncbi:uncharacterized protein LOC144105244 [Amblyomma americanum]
MMRFLAIAMSLLPYLAILQCAAELNTSGTCDVNQCNGTCKEYYGKKYIDVTGKCENAKCTCHFHTPCNEKACLEICQRQYNGKPGLLSNCTQNVCYCGYFQTCLLPRCAYQCQQQYPDKNNLEAFCKNDVCHCKWHSFEPGEGQPLKLPAGPLDGSETNLLSFRATKAFYLGEEAIEPKVR